jgi:hypothetical protein
MRNISVMLNEGKKPGPLVLLCSFQAFRHTDTMDRQAICGAPDFIADEGIGGEIRGSPYFHTHRVGKLNTDYLLHATSSTSSEGIETTT